MDITRTIVAFALSFAWLGAAAAPPYEWTLPRGFPRPAVPADNPMSAEKVALGRRLFYEKRLSVTGDYACASCHRQELAFTDGRARARGATGEEHAHSAMSLANVAYVPALQWADPDLQKLELQALRPMLNEHPVEMGLKGREGQVVAALAADPRYGEEFAGAFPGETVPVSLENIARALASFERTLVSGRSAFDRLLFDDDRAALSASARRGMALFFSAPVGCARCHAGINFSGPIRHAGEENAPASFANTGLYNVDGHGRYPATSPGLARHTGRERDHGRFRVPTLRNVAVTAPYMHDGSIATLAEVIDHYAAGGRQAPRGPIGRNRHRDERLTPLALSAQERSDLVAFLESLTDVEFLTDARFSDPAIDDNLTREVVSIAR
jgi:cytochrome c peroxidase